jgi:hypothetical protein
MFWLSMTSAPNGLVSLFIALPENAVGQRVAIALGTQIAIKGSDDDTSRS